MDKKRTNYWNKTYAKYWQARVNESNEATIASSIVKGDPAVPSDRLYVELIGLLKISRGTGFLKWDAASDVQYPSFTR